MTVSSSPPIQAFALATPEPVETVRARPLAGDRETPARSTPLTLPSMDPTEALIRAAQTGSMTAFEEIVTHFEAKVLTYLHHFTRNAHDAEDLTQETFVKVFRGLAQFEAGRSFAAWLFTIARRTAISHFRANRTVAFESPENLVNHADAADPAELLASKDDGSALWRLADRLKPRQREALWLHYGEDLSIIECARVMGLTTIHVKVLLHRGRHGLARLLRQRGASQAVTNLETRP